MKTLRKIGMAFLAVVLCASFVACSDDDDESNPLVGTWEYLSADGYDEGTLQFKGNGTVVWDDGEEVTSNHTYSLNGDKLKIVFNDNDDYTEGTISFSENKAQYVFYWADCAGEWKDESTTTWNFTKK